MQGDTKIKMANIKSILLNVIKIVFGAMIVGLAVSGDRYLYPESSNYIIFTGVLMIVVGLVLLILEEIGKAHAVVFFSVKETKKTRMFYVSLVTWLSL